MEILIEEEYYPVVIVKKNNKNTYIRVNKDLEIIVTTSSFTTSRQITHLLEENIESVKKMLNRQKKEKLKNDNFYYLGKKYDIIIVPVLDTVEIENNVIYVKGMKELQKWYQREMKTLFVCRMKEMYDRFTEDIPYPKLKIRAMKTRWGVCNKRDTSVTLNANLMKESVECLDYVIIHELSHLVHFDHSKAFWNTVETYCQDYKKIRKKLKE